VQLVVFASNTSAGHALEVPVQFSATSHCPPSARHTVAADKNTSLQVFAVPEHLSVPSHAPLFNAPVQVTVLASNASAGHALEVPVQFSATSHCPPSARHTVAADKKTSLQVFAVPEHLSVPSHAPPFNAPVQVTVLASNASAGQVPDVPVQFSAMSHCPASARQVVVDGEKTSTHVFAVPEHLSCALHAPPFTVPVQFVEADAKPFTGQALLLPVQFSATSQVPADARHTTVFAA
jgi:hypothetical protein